MTDRHIRVVSLLRELAASYIQQEANADPLITVTDVTTSPDYRNATIFFTTIPSGREADATVWLTRHGREMRHFIMKKSNLKIIPHFDFMLDAGERHRQHVDEVFRDIESGKKS